VLLLEREESQVSSFQKSQPNPPAEPVLPPESDLSQQPEVEESGLEVLNQPLDSALTRYGLQAERSLLEARPKDYARLKAKGKLLPTLLRAQRSAKAVVNVLVGRGQSLQQAEELAFRECLQFPPEDEVPRLGEPPLEK
jgi:hypothetical protein